MVSNFFSKNRLSIYRLILVLFSIILIAIPYPVEQKFRYEFSKSAPWQHEDLFAPYSFAINKLPEEIKSEIDSINKNIKMYFHYDKNIEDNMTTKIKKDFEKEWTKLLKQDSILKITDSRLSMNLKNQKKQYLKILDYYITYLTDIYNKGVYDPFEITNYSKEKNYKLVFSKNNLVKTYLKDQVFSLKTSYEYLSENFTKYLETQNNKNYFTFFSKFSFDKYLVQNLFFDETKTEEIKKLSLANLSRTRGLIQSEELIISKGEIVSLEKYRILMSLKSDYENSSGKNSIFLIQLGTIIVIALFITMLFLFLRNNKPLVFNDLRSMLMIYLLLIFFVDIVIITSRLDIFSVYLLPIALLPVILKIFFDEQIALFTLLITILLLGLIVPNAFEFIILQFVGGFAAIFGLNKLSRRGQLYISTAVTFISMSIIYFAIAIIQEGLIEKISGINFLYFAIYSLFLMLAYPLIYGLERIFGFISDMTLLELSNTNHKLLQNLATKAPGTFQHCIQVASLAEAAANKIGANELLIRVGALYHDIGKTNSPAFFIENQVSGFNPHSQIDFEQSAKIIINHVTCGITLATKNKLPQQIIDFIRTHHGTSTVQYFYKNYIKKYPDRTNEIDKFKYPGPRPFSKETAILMMADSIEAASRSLKIINQNTISELVEGIIDHQMNSKQFEEADINFKEISTLKNLFKERLMNIYHARIEYPK